MRQSFKYNPGINFLRSVSILAIVLYHVFPFAIPGGFLGVCFFFLISGYLAARQGNLQWQNGEFRLRKYYIKKALRIYPSMYIMIVSVVAFFTLFHRELLLGMREEAASIFCGVNNWWQIQTHASYFNQITEHSPFTHLWYMGVEMELLLVWPLLFIPFKKWIEPKFGKKASGLFLLLAIASGILMGLLYNRANINRVYYGTDTRAFAFFLGVCLGFWEDAIIAKWKGKLSNITGRFLFMLLLLISIALMVLVKGQSPWLYLGGMFAICLLFSLVILVMNSVDAGELMITQSKLFQYLGKKSYLIYLWHYPLLFILVYLY